jgi:PAS domain S-box-containing protein
MFKVLKYFVLSYIFLALAFYLHRITETIIFPHMTHGETAILIILIFSILITIVLSKIRNKYFVLENEKNCAFKSLFSAKMEFKALFDNDLTGICITDGDGLITDVNNSFLKIFDYDTRSEIVGKKNLILYSDVNEYDHILNEIRNKKQIYNYQTTRKKKNGDLIYVCESLMAEFDSDGKLIKIKSYVIDVTSRVNSEKLLENIEIKFSKVVNSTTSAFYFYNLIDNELIFTGANPAANKIIGIRHEELIGKRIAECFPNLPSHIPELYKGVARGDLKNQSFDIEYSEDRFSGIYAVDVFRIDKNEIAVNFVEISEKKEEANKQLFLKNTLDILNKGTEWDKSIKIILSKLKEFSQLDAVGIRFENNNDFPFYFQEGFSEEFLSTENSICSRNHDGSVKLDRKGNPVYECTCGLLLSTENDITRNYLTSKGSILINHSEDFHDTIPVLEHRINPRNACLHHGYQSILLVPIVIGEKIVGLLQMNSKIENIFTSARISFYEEICNILGIAYEKVLKEQSIKDGEEMFSAFMNHIPANIYIKDSDGRFIYGNKKLRSCFGSTWLGKKASEFLGKEEAYKVLNDDLETYKKGYLWIDEKYRSSDNKLYYYETQKFIISRSGKSPMLGGITFDVTERHSLIKSNLENEERWKFALESNQDGVWDWNIENNEVFLSNRFKEMLGFNQDEVHNSMEEWSKIVHPDDHKKCLEEVNLHLKGEIPFYSNIHRICCKDGSYKWILDRGKVVKYSDGSKPLRMIGTYTDLTERIQLENQLKELNSTKDKIMSIIGHDLRNPIANIVNFTELLRSEYDGNKAKRNEYIEIISSSAERTLGLLSDLLIWTKAQTGEIEFKPELLNVDSIIKEVLEVLYPNAVLKALTINNSCNCDLVCYADKQMLRTILRNLLQNAIKFTNSGGVIGVSAVSDQDNIVIVVSDTGIGIDSETRNKLFEGHGYTSKYGTAGEYGYGLGLKICQEFVERHYGSIWVESEMGYGSKFYFSLPTSSSVKNIQ